ncbi:MAG: class I SAM-dependent methyltransferase [Marinilabiliales bacterium]|nr:MAG: class I SAM-dependent methyltransferase [Marinilabiliales bacterium]
MKENKRKGSSSEELLDKEIILDELRITTGQTILEIGCGNGYMSKEFSKLVGEKGKVYAVDIQIELIDKLKKEISETNIIPLLSDITKDKIEVNDNSIDLIYLATVFHIFSNEQIEVFQKEVNRLLKVGGKLVILNIDKKESSFGPPQNMRVSNEELNHIIKMKPVISVKLGESFYMQIFEKIDKN